VGGPFPAPPPLRLGTAGRTALERGDLHAAQNLLRRAVALASDGEERRRLIPDLADALIEGREHFAEVERLLDELEAGDAHDRSLAVVLRLRHDPGGDLKEQLAWLDEAETVLTAAGDTLGLARGARARGWAYWNAARNTDAHVAWRRAHELLRQAGSRILHREVVFDVCISAALGGVPDPDRRRRLFDELELEAEAAGPLLAVSLRCFRARMQYLAGEVAADVVRSTTDEEVRLLEETGAAAVAVASSRHFADTMVPWIEGDSVAVEAGARRWVEKTAAAARNLYHANALGEWAAALCDLRHHERALSAVDEARALADPSDVADQTLLDHTEAYALALAGEPDRALALLERGRERARAMDSGLPGLGDPSNLEASVLRTIGDVDAARRVLRSLIDHETTTGRHRVADRYSRDLDGLDATGRD
jgi:tetratricopeptide (TPR) repeat protein